MENFHKKLIWNNCIPTKISFFAWEVLWGKILTMEQLRKKGRHLTSRCPLCGKDEESLDFTTLRFTTFGLSFLRFFGFTGPFQDP